jgi:hypothetical protein
MKLNTFAFTALFLVASCSGKTKFGSIELPEWVIDETKITKMDDEIAAVGMSKGNENSSLRTMITQAEADARKNLAGKIATSVNAKAEDLIKEVKSSNNCKADEKNKQICNTQFLSSFEEKVSTSVNDVQILNTTRRHISTGKDENGTNIIYVALSMPKSMAKVQVDKVLSDIANQSKSKETKSLTEELSKQIKAEEL